VRQIRTLAQWRSALDVEELCELRTPPSLT